MTRINKKLLITVFLVAIFFLSVGVWYSPIVFKGYPSQTISEGIILARNYYQSNILAEQSDANVTLASSLIKENGHPLALSENFGSFLYAQIFKITGIPDYDNLVLISVVFYALALILFTVLILYLFGFKTALVFSLIYIFSPIGWGLTHSMASYEFCLIFWALFFILYFLGVKKNEQSQNKFNNIFFVLSGLFLFLSTLSKDVVLVFALMFFIFLLIKKLKQQLIYIFIPFVLLLMIFWIPSVLKGENSHLPLLVKQSAEEAVFSTYLHIFPDPYTYYFEKEEYLKGFRNQDLGWSEDLEIKKNLTNFGFDNINLFERVRVGFYILSQHVSRFFSLEDFGGPFILLLSVLGLVYLRNKYRFLYNLSVFWIVVSLFVFAFVVIVSRSHLMDFIWILILLIALGLIYLSRIIINHLNLKKNRAILLQTTMVILAVYHLILVNHEILGKQYDKDFIPRSLAYVQEVNDLEIRDTDVIAIPGDFSAQITTLNYLTDKSFVIFKESTLNKLLSENKLKQAFDFFGVKYILGYSDDLSKELSIKTGVVNIASDSLEINLEEVSKNKSFFMNLFR